MQTLKDKIFWAIREECNYHEGELAIDIDKAVEETLSAVESHYSQISKEQLSSCPRWVKVEERNPSNIKNDLDSWFCVKMKNEQTDEIIIGVERYVFANEEWSTVKGFTIISWLEEGAAAQGEDGWITGKMPQIIEGFDYSENVLAEVEGYPELQVMAVCWVPDSGFGHLAWCNCNGELHGDPHYDDNYNVLRWMPIPKPPKS